jgi:acyl carrier protein
MTKTEFVKQLSRACEFESDDLLPETLFSSVGGYDSLAVMTIIAFADENFNTKLTALQLQQLTDFNSLMALIGLDHFDND